MLRVQLYSSFLRIPQFAHYGRSPCKKGDATRAVLPNWRLKFLVIGEKLKTCLLGLSSTSSAFDKILRRTQHGLGRRSGAVGPGALSKNMVCFRGAKSGAFSPIFPRLSICGMVEGSLEVKLPTIWTDEKQSRAEAERRGRLEERRSEEKE